MANDSLNESTQKDSEMSLQYGRILNISSIIQNITAILIVIFGIYLISINKLSSTNLLIIFMHRTSIFDLILCYTSIRDYYSKYKLASSRVFEMMNNDKFPKDVFGTKKIENIKGKIEFRDLSFSYDKKQVLNNINLTINSNDTIGIVGASGSGKTTLLNLLSKSYYVNDNQIFIDDIDINELSRDFIRNNISYITQNPYIFNLSLKDNLKLVGNNISDGEMINACKVAQIHDYIDELPDKYDTLLGESGINLSGGQRQRVAIARALLKKSKIILFDEATSALDNITQSELQKSINNISDDYTIIVVAHRLSTIRSCNKICVMDNGQIVGVGTHNELLENNKYYKKLYNEEEKM